MLALCWEYLSGRSVATDPTDRNKAEWPPHPDRVIQAMVASWAGSGAVGQEALSWLCSQSPPSISVPELVTDCAVVRTFVPTNDIEGPSRGNYTEKHLPLLPNTRKRSGRSFPAVHVGSALCALVWPEAEPSTEIRGALERLCHGVTHIGHSSSMVRMWIEADAPTISFVPRDTKPEIRLRVPDSGRMQDLVTAYAGGGQDWVRPPVARWQGYGRPQHQSLPRGALDDRLVVLRQMDGPRLSLIQTLALTRALRGTLIKAADGSPDALRLISGHEADGKPLADAHLAYFPLAFVGDPTARLRHADGHIMGAAIALPSDLDGDAEQGVFDAFAKALQAGAGRLHITMGSAGAVTLAVEDSAQPARSLKTETWVQPSRTWATVTPIGLDRSPPRRHADQDEWAAQQIAQACTRQGLPEPASVHLLPVSAHVGAPPAFAFAPLVRKDGSRRWHTHALIRFDQSVAGPILLGAGRHHGYGLCKPLNDGENMRGHS